MAAYGKRNLPLPPGLTILGDESSGYGIEQNNELRQQEKNLFTEIGECSQGAYSSSGTLCSPMLVYYGGLRIHFPDLLRKFRI
ncbi:MAG: hypothetical protein B1H40_03375 [Candidatus Latescibacteria bacterium 4484_181]|nr:MAG: hypothetical protein B1H40_03375 [Candidatus Latescibacteria bacterium 4484_181]